MDREPTKNTRERATNEDQQPEHDAQSQVNDLLSTSIESAEPDLADVASELAAEGAVRPEDIVAGTNLEDPLATERRGLDVFHANELSGIDTGSSFQPASTTDRFGGALSTGREADSSLGGGFGASEGDATSPLGPGFDTSLGSDDNDGGPDGSAPSLPGQATDDPSTMLEDKTEEPNSSQPEDAPEEPNSSQPEDAPPAEQNFTPDQLESTQKPPDEGDVRQVVGRLASGLGLDPADEDDEDGRDGGAPRGYETGEILPVATLRTSDNHGDYVNPGTGDIDIDFDQASQDLARAFGANSDIYSNPGWGDATQGGGLQPQQDIEPGAIDPEDDDGME